MIRYTKKQKELLNNITLDRFIHILENPSIWVKDDKTYYSNLHELDKKRYDYFVKIIFELEKDILDGDNIYRLDDIKNYLEIKKKTFNTSVKEWVKDDLLNKFLDFYNIKDMTLYKLYGKIEYFCIMNDTLFKIPGNIGPILKKLQRPCLFIEFLEKDLLGIRNPYFNDKWDAYLNIKDPNEYYEIYKKDSLYELV